jgi:hypothetical protein
LQILKEQGSLNEMKPEQGLAPSIPPFRIKPYFLYRTILYYLSVLIKKLGKDNRRNKYLLRDYSCGMENIYIYGHVSY